MQTGTTERRALDRVVRWVLRGLGACVLVLPIPLAVAFRGVAAPAALLLVGLVPLAGLAALRAGRSRLAAWIASVGVLVLLAGVSVVFGGPDAGSLRALGIPVMLAALLLGWRQGVAVAALAWSVVVAYVAIESATGWTFGHKLTRLELLVSDGSMLFAIAGLLGVFGYEMHRGWAEARRSADATQAALERNQAEVERRRQVEERLREAVTAAMAASQAKSRFLANMSHELRTPLNAIIGYSEILAEEHGEEPGTLRDLARIQSSGRHLLVLINDVLDLARVESGRFELEAVTVDVVSMLDELATTAEPLMRANDNTLTVRVDGAVGDIVSDPTRLRQVLLNLLSNAAKFTRSGRVELVACRIETHDGRAGLRFEVRDTGIGIPAEVRSRLFEPFMQADATTRRRFGGSGLGLTLCTRFLELMGGRITVDSVPGEGSTFAVELPVESPEVYWSRVLVERLEQARTSFRPVVLCVDDDPHALDLLDRTLGAHDLHVVPLTSGSPVVELARQLRPTAITLDVHLPDVDGWQLLEELKADPELTSIPVVMVTVDADEGVGAARGAAEHLRKPVDRAQLVRLLDRLVEGEGPVLVVEDDEPTRALLVQTLADIGQVVVEARDGVEALDRLAEHRPSLVLLDLMMPRMDGFAVAQRMRETEDWATIPVVVLTAATLTADDQQRLSCCIRVVSKSGEDVLESVVEAIRAARYAVAR